MRYFTLTQRRVERSKWTGGFDLGREWVLPGVECPTCKEAWGGGGYDYPTVDLSALPERRDYERARCVPWAQFVSLRQRVLPLVPEGSIVEPGTGFGALTGKAKGKFPPIVIHVPWMLLVQPAVVGRLEGLTGVVPARTRLRARPGVADLVELEVRPGGSIRGADAHKPCRTCGRTDFVLPPFGKLRLEEVPSVDFARVCPTVVAVSERVVARLANELEESEIDAVDITGPRRGAGSHSAGIDVSP
ncbi:double-CXXCG motif protein [Myxococcus sp. AB025B]|uniref:SitI6 family double-CXXCG motif immunity protein n=1 Tax=Myxococcus sp. AB025B TaxID=2562794 RepID=UPI001142E148|nr:double-CXXCG motif protein [Myxococcus sp. AB025B]